MHISLQPQRFSPAREPGERAPDARRQPRPAALAGRHTVVVIVGVHGAAVGSGGTAETARPGQRGQGGPHEAQAQLERRPDAAVDGAGEAVIIDFVVHGIGGDGTEDGEDAYTERTGAWSVACAQLLR